MSHKLSIEAFKLVPVDEPTLKLENYEWEPYVSDII